MATALMNSDYSSLERYDYESKNVRQCGQKSHSQTEVSRHRLEDCDRRNVECSFCQECQPSSACLRDHLMLCGNKTDQCPNCRKFIRRAIFAYHYENGCANLDEFDTPAIQLKSSKMNKFQSLENSLTNDHQENNRHSTSVNFRSDGLDRIASATSKNRSSLNLKQCEYCRNSCERCDYKESCLENPINLIRKQQRRSLVVNENEYLVRRKEMDGIPCEFCNEQINFSQWNTHIKHCQDREIRRLETRAETISREPVTETFSCEFCDNAFPSDRIEIHQRSCEKNPENIARATRLDTTRQPTIVAPLQRFADSTTNSRRSSNYPSLPSTTQSAQKHSPSVEEILLRIKDHQKRSTLHNEPLRSHLSVDVKPGSERSKLSDRDMFISNTNGYEPSMRNVATNDTGPLLMNSSSDVSTYDHPSLLRDRHLSTSTRSLSIRGASTISRRTSSVDRASAQSRRMPSPQFESSNNRTPPSQSASRNSLDSRGSLRPIIPRAIYRLNDHDVIFHSPREEDLTHKPKLNHRVRSAKVDSRPAWK